MAKDKSVTKAEPPDSHVTVLVIVDAETLMSRSAHISHSEDAPTIVNGEHLYVMTPRDEEPLGRNDGHLDLAVNPGNHIHIRGNALALRGEHIVLFHGIAQESAEVVSPFELVLRANVTVPMPSFDNLLHASSQSIDDHFWQSEVLARGVVACDLNFMVLDKACAVLGYFRSRLQISISGFGSQRL